jgi:hypothetical protein
MTLARLIDVHQGRPEYPCEVNGVAMSLIFARLYMEWGSMRALSLCRQFLDVDGLSLPAP